MHYAPIFKKKVGDKLVSACPYVCLYVCMDIVLKLHVWNCSWKNSRRLFLVFPESSPLVKLRPFDKQRGEIL